MEKVLGGSSSRKAAHPGAGGRSMTDRIYIGELPSLKAADVPSQLAPQLADGKEAVALVYCPDACVIARVTEQGFATPSGAPDLECAYEMVVFCNDWEFRWVRDGKLGNAIMIADKVGQVISTATELPV